MRELAWNKDSVVSARGVSPVVEFLARLGGGAGRGGGAGLRIAGVFLIVDRAEYAAEVHIRSRAGLQEVFRGWEFRLFLAESVFCEFAVGSCLPQF